MSWPSQKHLHDYHERRKRRSKTNGKRTARIRAAGFGVSSVRKGVMSASSVRKDNKENNAGGVRVAGEKGS